MNEWVVAVELTTQESFHTSSRILSADVDPLSYGIIKVPLPFRPRQPYNAFSAVAALASAGMELFTKRGLDTITCPIVAMMVLVPLVMFWGAA
jgi:hypothetical protein